MKNIFQIKRYQFPYEYKFPGQASGERILYITRENRLLLVTRQLFVIFAAAILLFIGLFVQNLLVDFLNLEVGSALTLFFIGMSLAFLLIGWWWVTTLWNRSVAIITTQRLIKFIYTTPVSRYSLALPLDTIVDTGAFTRGFIQTFLKLETFVARSSASSSGVATDDPTRVNKKYFYIQNIKRAEDLQHYVSKLLAVRKDPQKDLQNFRPFLPQLKGESRASFIAEHFPQFWS